MKKTLFFAAAAIAMLASCSQNDLEAPVVAQSQQGDAIEFGTYTGQSAQTRTVASGTNGAIVTNENLQSKGFGVFAYYTGTKTYDATQYWDGTSAVADANKIAPNFMWNQSVTWNSTAWAYTPLKYWPNESSSNSTNVDGSNAGTDYTHGGNVSFFAYAPYVTKTAAEGANEGIVGISAKNAKGDPIITYTVPTSANSVVDLLWGTVGESSGYTTGETILGGGNAGVAHNGSANAASYPYAILSDGGSGYTLNADLTKQKISGKVGFAFKHALAKVGGIEGLKIQTDVDAVSGGALDQKVEGGNVTGGTKVTVKSITIVAKSKNSAGDYYDTQKGEFNLATGKWNITGTTTGAAAQTTYTISDTKLNTDIKETGTTWDSQPKGVYGTAQNVYKSAAEETDPIIFIPGTKPELTVTINYMVRTKDDGLEKGYTEVEQNITKTITFANEVALNKYYTLVIHLGLTSVKFTAEVSDWADGGSDTTGSKVDLPINVE